MADVTCRATKADCVVINSGTLRSKSVHRAGNFTKGVSNRSVISSSI